MVLVVGACDELEIEVAVLEMLVCVAGVPPWLENATLTITETFPIVMFSSLCEG